MKFDSLYFRKSFSYAKLRSHVSYQLLILITVALFFIGIPLFFLSPDQSAQHLELAKNSDVLIALTISFTALFILINSVYWFFVLVKLRKFGAIIVIFLFSWVSFGGLLFPLTTADGMFALSDGPTNWFNLIMLSVISVVSTYCALAIRSKVTLIFFAIFFGGALIPKIPKLISESETRTGYGQVEMSADKNIIVLGLDGIPGNVTSDVLEQFPEFKKALKDFTYFSNAAASSPATEASLMGIVFGNGDYTRVNYLKQEVVQKVYFSDNSKYNFFTNRTYKNFNINGTKVAPNGPNVMDGILELLALYKNVTLRLFTKKAVRITEGLEKKLIDVRPPFQNSTDNFDKTMQGFTLGSNRISVIYMHFLFTHFPITLDENCIYRGHDTIWEERNQNEAGLKNLTVCGLLKLKEFIDHLKNIGVYDNSLIVLYSDHGKPVNYFSSPPNNLRINNNPFWGFNRYRPLLMIKDFGAQGDILNVDERIVLLDDIAKTTCRSVESSEYCKDIQGLDLLDENDVAPSDFFIHVVKDENSTWKRGTHMAVRISRMLPLEDAIRAHDQIILSNFSINDRPIIGGHE